MSWVGKARAQILLVGRIVLIGLYPWALLAIQFRKVLEIRVSLRVNETIILRLVGPTVIIAQLPLLHPQLDITQFRLKLHRVETCPSFIGTQWEKPLNIL